MRPVLVHLPSKLALVAALALALGVFIHNVIRRRKDKAHPWSSTPLYLLVAAFVLVKVKTGELIPTAAGFSAEWTPVPIYSYGVMLGTSMIVGWFLAMSLAKQDGVPQDQAGAIYMWTALWSIVGARVLYVIVQWQEFQSPLEMFMVNRGGLVAYGGMIGGFLASWYGCLKRKFTLLLWDDNSDP
jgi:hypothetical protein